MKTKEHRFIVTVETTKSQAATLSTVRGAFFLHMPDAYKFHVADHATYTRRQRARITKVVNSWAVSYMDGVLAS